MDDPNSLNLIIDPLDTSSMMMDMNMSGMMNSDTQDQDSDNQMTNMRGMNNINRADTSMGGDDDGGSDRRVWAPEEDEAIRALVTKYGTKTWSIIAEQILKEYNIEGRTGKQCRERWHNHLGIFI